MTPSIAALLVLLAAAGSACTRPTGSAADAVAVRDVVTHTLSDRDAWGWHGGVKQPLGAFKDGLSVHQLTRRIPEAKDAGAPDNLAWVDERTNGFGIAENPTGAFGAVVEAANPGGAVAFGPDGRIWYVVGGRANAIAPHLFVSRRPRDVTAFEPKLVGFVAQGWSTTFNLQVAAGQLFLFWRHGASQAPHTTVRMHRYDVAGDFAAPEAQVDLGSATSRPPQKPIGIEQNWTRFDARHGRLLVTWEWYDLQWLRRTPVDRRFGSNPVLYSDDAGRTWRSVDGAVREALPIDYTHRDPVLVPYDHFAAGEWTGWQNHDLGVSPNGTFWVVEPIGKPDAGRHPQLAFFFFADGAWQRRDLVAGCPMGKPYAAGATRRYVVVVHADPGHPNVLLARISPDDGRTWSPPREVAALPSGRVIDWVSYAQPADPSPDDAIRFFFTHFDPDQLPPGAAGSHMAVGWVKFAVGPSD